MKEWQSEMTRKFVAPYNVSYNDTRVPVWGVSTSILQLGSLPPRGTLLLSNPVSTASKSINMTPGQPSTGLMSRSHPPPLRGRFLISSQMLLLLLLLPHTTVLIPRNKGIARGIRRTRAFATQTLNHPTAAI